MRLALYLVRHGQTDHDDLGLVEGQAESQLTVAGLREADRVGSNFQHVHIDEVHHSPLKRCEATAEAIIAHLPSAPPTKPDMRLTDRGMGSLENTVRHYYIPEPADVETWDQVAARTRQWLQDLLTERMERGSQVSPAADGEAVESYTVLVVSHDTAIVSLLNQLLDPKGPVESRLAEGVTPCQSVDSGSISRVLLTSGVDRWSAVIHSWGGMRNIVP